MYARSTTVKAQNNAIDQGIAQVRDEVLPAVTAMDGCIGLSMMVDRTSGECIVTTAWENEEKMRATAEAVKPLRARATEILSGTSSVQEWEIAVMHRDHQAGDGSFCRSTWIATEPSNADHALDVYRMAILPQDRGAGRLLQREHAHRPCDRYGRRHRGLRQPRGARRVPRRRRGDPR